MSTKVLSAVGRGSASQAVEELQSTLQQSLGAATPALVMVFTSPQQPLVDVLPQLRQSFPKSTVLGASSYNSFTELGEVKGASTAVALVGDYRVHFGIGHGLRNDVVGAVTRAIASLPESVADHPHRTAILLVDAMSGAGEEATLVASQMLGEGVRMAGAAAADDMLMQRTQVGANGEVAEDAVVVAMLYSKKPLGVGVCHGHRAFSAPMTVTRATGNLVHEIDGRPAWDAWKEKAQPVATRSGIVNLDNLEGLELQTFLATYEAGLTVGSELKVRAPLGRQPDGSLIFACGVAEGSVIRLTESDSQGQVQSARKAAARAIGQLEGDVAGAVVFDCACRKVILKDRFTEAVSAIGQSLGNMPLAGFETFGEIAADVGDLSGFHNTTTVVLAFPR